MIEFECKVVGATEVAVNLESMTARIHARIRRAVEGSGIELQKGVKEQRLTGQALNVRTGRLRRSITQQTEDDGTSIVSRTGLNVVYGRFWELGFHGTEKIAGHHRRVFRTTKAGRRGKVTNVAWVRPHTRKVDQEARPFLRPELNTQSARIRVRIYAAVSGK